MKDQIIAKQEELIAHYEAKPIVGMRATKESNDWMDKKYDLIDELESLKQQAGEVKVFIDIAPSKDKKVCSNCSYWLKWGTHTGTCDGSEEDTDQNDTCDSFIAKQSDTTPNHSYVYDCDCDNPEINDAGRCERCGGFDRTIPEF
jgi:hypothetical protein